MGHAEATLFAAGILYIFTFAFGKGASNGSDEMVLLHLVWRHGDRSPVNNFSTNPDQLISWPEGSGELTKMGIANQFGLGQYLRERYAAFLPKIALEKTIYVRSTDYNRTLMSALAVLAAMFPPDHRHQWSKNISWQPIPVHTQRSDIDDLLHMSATCPKADILRQNTWRSKEVQDVMKANEEFFAFLREKTGEKLNLLDDIRKIYDPINCARIHNKYHPLPSWVTDEIFAKIKELFIVSTTFWVKNPAEKRLRGALLLQDIMNRMVAASGNNGEDKLKLYAYSAHDETLVALLENLEVYNSSLFPYYSSVIIIELHRVGDESFVKVLYKIGNDTEAVDLKLPFCDVQCPLDVFVDHYRGRAPINWRYECGLETLHAAWRTYAIVAFALAAIAISIAVAQTVYWIARYRRNQSTYALLDNDDC